MGVQRQTSPLPAILALARGVGGLRGSRPTIGSCWPLSAPLGHTVAGREDAAGRVFRAPLRSAEVGEGTGSVQSQGLGHRGGLSYSTLPQLIRMALSSNWEWGVPSGRECCNGQGVRRTDRCDKWRLVLSACADVADM